MKKTITTIICLLACLLPAADANEKKHRRSPVEQEFGPIIRKQETRIKKDDRPGPRASSRTTAAEMAVLNRYLATSVASQSPAQRRIAPARYNPSLPTLRAVNPKDGSKSFHINPGAHLFDGNGNKRGTIARGRNQVQLNYGQSRQIKGSDGYRHKYYYAFATNLRGGNSASGWIRATALQDKPRMPVVNAKRPPAGRIRSYIITGSGVNQQYGDLKVVKNYNGPHRAAADYGRRPGGYVNELLTLPGKGGMSTDTWKVGTTFQRVYTVPSILRPLYRPGSNDHAGDIRFVYGFVSTPTGPRFGWIANQALKH